MTTLAAIDQRLGRIESILQAKSEWLPENLVIMQYDLSKKYLQNLRKSGMVRFRSINGRKFRYNAQDLEGLFK